MHIRPVTTDDAADWLEMRCTLWPDSDRAAHHAEITRYLTTGSFAAPEQPWIVLLACDAESVARGFAEASVRPFAEGCSSARVAYLEGWFVRDDARRSGVGRALIEAVEAWGRTEGCTEFASDTEVENIRSRAAHVALGFTDLGAIHCFRKTIAPSPPASLPATAPRASR